MHNWQEALMAHARRVGEEAIEAWSRGSKAGVTEKFEEALRSVTEAVGTRHSFYTETLYYYAWFLLDTGEQDRAWDVAGEALATNLELYGQSDPRTVESRAQVTRISLTRNDLAAASESLERLVAVLPNDALDPDDVRSLMDGLARRFADREDWIGLIRIWTLRVALEEAIDASSLRHAEALQDLSAVYLRANNVAAARPLLMKAAELARLAGDEGRPLAARALNDLASAEVERGDLAAAEEHLIAAVDLYERFDSSGENTAIARQNLDMVRAVRAASEGRTGGQADILERDGLTDGFALYARLMTSAQRAFSEGDSAAAEKAVEEAFEKAAEALAGRPFEHGIGWELLALVRARMEKIEGAVDALERASSLFDRHLVTYLRSTLAHERRAMFRTTVVQLDLWMSLLSRVDLGSRGKRVVFEFILRRKMLDEAAASALRDSMAMASDPAVADGLLSTLRELRRASAELEMTGPAEGEDGVREFMSRRMALRDRIRELERELAFRTDWTQIESAFQAVSVDTLLAALGDDSALVECMQYRAVPLDAAGRGLTEVELPLHLGIFCLTGDGELRYIDVPDAAGLAVHIAAFREEVQSRAGTAETTSTTDAAIALRKLLAEPILEASGFRRRLFLCPDGELWSLPFAALPVGDRLVLDWVELTWFSSARDFIRTSTTRPLSPRESPLVVAAPEFGQGEFEALPGTRAEAQALKQILGVPPCLGADATKTRVLGVKGPLLLHLATHGFFDTNAVVDDAELLGVEVVVPAHAAGGRADFSRLTNPMLRSGLVLAGANDWLRGQPTTDQIGTGLVSAEEVAGMDLRGTALVVLSACETGLGDVRRGQGVFGLRRAFELAGARTVVSTLWKIPDDETTELVTEYYERLQAGEPRAAALRHAQLSMKARYGSEYAWAGFVSQGDPSSIEPLPRHQETNLA